MSSYRKQGGLLRSLIGESQSHLPVQEPCTSTEEQQKDGASPRNSLDIQRISPQGSLFAMDGPAPSSSVVGRSYLRAPLTAGTWGVSPHQPSLSSSPPHIDSSCSSAGAVVKPPFGATDHSRTIGFAVPSAPTSLPRPSGVSPSTFPHATTLASTLPTLQQPEQQQQQHHHHQRQQRQQQQQQQQQQVQSCFAAGNGDLAEPLLQKASPQQFEPVPMSPRATWSKFQGAPALHAGLNVATYGLPFAQTSNQKGLLESCPGLEVSLNQAFLQQDQDQKQQQEEQQQHFRGMVGASQAVKGRAEVAQGVATVPPPGIVDGGNLKAVVFGLINGAVGLPALIAFAAIVFQAPLYATQLGSLCKMFFFSSAIHQLVFCARSTLPFAIGQVQDVGLIFLSAMATSIAVICTDAGLSAQVALGTTLLTLSISTTIVGLLTVLVGKYRLAQLVQYVPLPVVGGYLGYVGYFCMAGGIALGTSTTISTLYSWTNLLTLECLIKLIPTVVTSVTFILIMERCSHPLALPAGLLSVPVLFHVALLASGYTLKDAQATGWVIQPPVDGKHYFWQLWDMFNIRQHGLAGIYWPALQAQGAKLAGLFLVVCFGSCMDVAAIQQDIPRPLDFNRELTTVGISNVCVGLIGAGYTGSYIFSQTVFTMRAGVYNRLCGLVVAFMELIVFALPFSVVEYCPSFFFGALLLWFGTEICRDWLLLSFRKLSLPEYALLWATFALIMALGLEAGIVAGIIASTLYFAYEYARSQVAALHQVAASSGTAHGYEAARLLDLMASRHVAMSLSGYVFFGSSLALSSRVEEVANKLLRDVSMLEAAAESALSQHQAEALSNISKRGPLLPPTHLHPSLRPSAQQPQADLGGGVPRSQQLQPQQLTQQQQQQPRAQVGVAPEMPLPHSLAWADAVKAMSDASLYVILDCRHVTHVDATGARTFGSLNNSLGARGVRLLFAGLNPKATAVRKLLGAHGVQLRAGPEVVLADLGTAAAAAALHLEQQRQQRQTEGGWCWEFRSLAAAVAHVERSYLATALARGLLPAPFPKVGLQEVLSTHADELPMPSSEVASLVASLAPYFHKKQLVSGEVLLHAGQSVEQLFLVEEGFLQLHLGLSGDTGSTSTTAAAIKTATATASAAAPHQQSQLRALQQQQQQQQQLATGFGNPASVHEAGNGSKEVHVRTSQYGPGCFVAAHEFFLRRPAAATAVAVTTPTTTTSPPRSTVSTALTNNRQPSVPHAQDQAAALNHSLQGGIVRSLDQSYGLVGEGMEDEVAAAVRHGAGCTVLCLSRAAFEAALKDVPSALSLLQWAALRSVSLDLTAALDLMERNSTL